MDNLKVIDVCIICLCLIVNDFVCVNDVVCKCFGVFGVVKLNKQIIQVIVGVKVELIGDEMKKVVVWGLVVVVFVDVVYVVIFVLVVKFQVVLNVVIIVELVFLIIGEVVVLDQVLDEVFVSKVVGDGVVVKFIDKIVVFLVVGIIVKIFNINYVFCLEIEKGVEIVVYMGIDIVVLNGQGFKCLVEEGVEVMVGQLVLELDLDFLNVNVCFMISLVVCSNSDDFSVLVIKVDGYVVVGKMLLYEIKSK